MASESMKKKTKLGSYVGIHKLLAAVSLLTFTVVIIAGVRAEVSVVTITYRALVAMLVVGVVGRVIVKILSTYEEMNSGKA